MNYREYANQRANEIESIISKFAPEKKEITDIITDFLRNNTKLDKTNEALKSQAEKILNRELHWAELDWITNIIISTIDTSNIEDVDSIIKKALELIGVPKYQIDDINSDMNELITNITKED
jgi:hypothetical protein